MFLSSLYSTNAYIIGKRKLRKEKIFVNKNVHWTFLYCSLYTFHCAIKLDATLKNIGNKVSRFNILKSKN